MSESITFTASELYITWPTAKFRWYIQPDPWNPCSTIHTLQQWWEYSDGDGGWKDIEIVRETNEQQ
jgi:hypothetical protein